MNLKKYRPEVVASVLGVRESALCGFFSNGGRGRKGTKQIDVSKGLDIRDISRYISSESFKKELERANEIKGEYEELEAILTALGVVDYGMKLEGTEIRERVMLIRKCGDNE